MMVDKIEEINMATMMHGIRQSNILCAKVICCPPGTLWVTRYGVGWTVHGCDRLASTKQLAPVVNHVVASEVGRSFECGSTVEMIKWCYALEFYENLHDTTVGLSRNDKQALDIQYRTMCYLGDRYEVGLFVVT